MVPTLHEGFNHRDAETSGSLGGQNAPRLALLCHQVLLRRLDYFIYGLFTCIRKDSAARPAMHIAGAVHGHLPALNSPLETHLTRPG